MTTTIQTHTWKDSWRAGPAFQRVSLQPPPGEFYWRLEHTSAPSQLRAVSLRPTERPDAHNPDSMNTASRDSMHVLSEVNLR